MSTIILYNVGNYYVTLIICVDGMSRKVAKKQLKWVKGQSIYIPLHCSRSFSHIALKFDILTRYSHSSAWTFDNITYMAIKWIKFDIL